MLKNQETKGALVIDIGEKVIGNNDEAYACTTNSTGIGPVTRSIFIIERADAKDGFSDDIVHYNQKLRIVSNPLLYTKKLYLRSLPISPLHYARFSRKQEVALQTEVTYDTVWVLEHQDPNLRFKAEKSPVLANDCLLIKHCATDHHLASQFVEYRNDFGTEYEMSCFSFTTQNKSQQLNLEKVGSLSKDHPTKFNLLQNLWAINTSSDPSTDVPVEKKKEELNNNDFLYLIKGAVFNNGLFGIRLLELAFMGKDNSHSGKLSEENFTAALKECGVQLNNEEVKRLLTIIEEANGEISYMKLIDLLRVYK